ncbi:hypothetical protein F8388_010787 [Cannabis sativa]|uniref:Uncharacterized protein n=1 Tax=Cannabis sativa TaxID=3483 RepID=A0A7J6HBX8_CANSA|nr:hypothetical protein F8388_010787 [Cannabis sativa]
MFNTTILDPTLCQAHGSASEFGGVETNLGLIILNGIGDSDCFGGCAVGRTPGCRGSGWGGRDYRT